MTHTQPVKQRRRFPLHIHITTLFLVLTLLVGGIIAGVGFKLSRDMLEATATGADRRGGHPTVFDPGGRLSPLIFGVIDGTC
jgi:hypothetical protein